MEDVSIPLSVCNFLTLVFLAMYRTAVSVQSIGYFVFHLENNILFFVGQGVKTVLEERFKTGKNRWFFTKLRF